MKEKYIDGIYKCGHAWRTIVFAASFHEKKIIKDKYKSQICPKCQDKKELEKNA